MALNLNNLQTANSANPVQLGAQAEGDSGDSNLGLYAVIGSAILGGLGQRDTNEKNLEIAEKQMAFQERMSGTAYQRAVKDMIAAGLNPMLAYQHGGATTPAGATATMSNVLGSAVSSAQQGAAAVQQAQQVQQTQAQTENIKAQTEKTRSETISNAVNTRLRVAQAEDTEESANQRRVDSNARWSTKLLTDQQIRQLEAETYKAWNETGYKGAEFADLPVDPNSAFAADIRRRKAEAKLRELDINEAEANSRFYGTTGEAAPAARFVMEILKGLLSGRRTYNFYR